MPMRRCLDCKKLYDKDTARGLRCPTCQQKTDKARDQARGSASARGYGAQHRRRAKAVLDGAQQCCYCGGSPTAADPFVACHVYAQSRGGPANGPLAAGHRSCNSRAAGKLNRGKTRRRPGR